MKNFEELTHELNDDEKRIAVLLCQLFREKPGKKNTFKNHDLRQWLEKEHFEPISGPRLRKVIQFIRLNGMLIGLIASHSGYWLTEDPEELRSWIESMQERENAVRHSKRAGERDLFILETNTRQGKLFEDESARS